MNKNEENNFLNPPHHISITEELKSCPTLHDVLLVINNTFPRWIYKHSPNYSVDYKFFDNNWEKTCKHFNTHKQDIILVNFMCSDTPEYSLITTFSDLLTLFGISVKHAGHFITCESCQNTLPNKEVYEKLRRPSWPAVWKRTCSTC